MSRQNLMLPRSSRSRGWSRSRGLWQPALIAAAISSLAIVSASAADLSTTLDDAVAAPTPASPGWTFTVAPYAWMPALSGDVAYGPLKAHVQQDFSQILDNLDFAGMAVVEARYDRFALFSDLLYMKMSKDEKLPLGFEADVGIEMLQWTPAAAYSLVRNDRATFDVMAGARVWSVETSFGVYDQYVGLERQRTERWVDGIIGVKGQYSLTDSFFVSGWVLAGTGGSDFSWDLLGAVGYKVNDRFSAMAGYRAEGVDYRNGPFVFDAVIQGPILGGTIKF